MVGQRNTIIKDNNKTKNQHGTVLCMHKITAPISECATILECAMQFRFQIPLRNTAGEHRAEACDSISEAQDINAAHPGHADCSQVRTSSSTTIQHEAPRSVHNDSPEDRPPLCVSCTGGPPGEHGGILPPRWRTATLKTRASAERSAKSSSSSLRPVGRALPR